MCGLLAELDTWQKARSWGTGRSPVLKLRLGGGMLQSSGLEDRSAYLVEAYLLLSEPNDHDPFLVQLLTGHVTPM